MKKKTNQFARTAMTLLLAVLGSVGAWAQSEVVVLAILTSLTALCPSISIVNTP